MFRRILEGVKVALGVAALLLIAALFALMFWPVSLLGLLLLAWFVLDVRRWERTPRLHRFEPPRFTPGPPPKPGASPESSPVPAPPLPPVGHAGAALPEPMGPAVTQVGSSAVTPIRSRVVN